MNEDKLKLALCAILPTELEAQEICWSPEHVLRWKSSDILVLDTELLGICHMVEQQRLFGPFNRHLRNQYKQELHRLNRGCVWSAPWTARAEALATVLQIKI
jgi:hypothetical protein